MDLTWAFELL